MVKELTSLAMLSVFQVLFFYLAVACFNYALNSSNT